jgi:hypothetical protein
VKRRARPRRRPRPREPAAPHRGRRQRSRPSKGKWLGRSTSRRRPSISFAPTRHSRQLSNSATDTIFTIMGSCSKRLERGAPRRDAWGPAPCKQPPSEGICPAHRRGRRAAHQVSRPAPHLCHLPPGGRRAVEGGAGTTLAPQDRTTRDTYAHVLPSMQRDAARQLAALLHRK